MSFAYVATPGGKKSLQSLAMFLEEGKCYRVIEEKVLLI